MSGKLPSTESVNPRSAGLDLLSTPELVELIAGDQVAAVDAVLAHAEMLSQIVDEIAARLRRGGTLHYVGAGSSGRLAMLDAVEMPPTFGTDPELVQAHIAGGSIALVRAVEGAEDDAEAGDASMFGSVKTEDAVIGVSASGSAAFVLAAIERAKSVGAFTVALTSVHDSALANAAQAPIVLETGPEVLTGSTRLKAGTAQKIALNAISTAVMVKLGKVHDNLMVDVVANNRKLRARALRLIETLALVETPRAKELLEAAGGRVKVAVVMHRRKVDADGAQALLDAHGGRLRKLL